MELAQHSQRCHRRPAHLVVHGLPLPPQSSTSVCGWSHTSREIRCLWETKGSSCRKSRPSPHKCMRMESHFVRMMKPDVNGSVCFVVYRVRVGNNLLALQGTRTRGHCLVGLVADELVGGVR